MRDDKFYDFNAKNDLGLINPLNPDDAVEDYYDMYKQIQESMSDDYKKYYYQVDVKLTRPIDREASEESGPDGVFQLAYYVGSPLEPYSADVNFYVNSKVDTLECIYAFVKKLTPAEERYLGQLVKYEMLNRWGRDYLYRAHSYYEEKLNEDGDDIDFAKSNNWKVTKKWIEGSVSRDLSYIDEIDLPPMKKI